jgi:hypothetical protein
MDKQNNPAVTAANLLAALRGVNPWIAACITILLREDRDDDLVEQATGLLWWTDPRDLNGRVMVLRTLRSEYLVFLDRTLAVQTGPVYCHRRDKNVHEVTVYTPAQRAVARDKRKASLKAAAVAYTAARLAAEKELRHLSPVQRGHWAKYCSHYTKARPAPVAGWEAYYGQQGGTVGRNGLPSVAAQGALRRAALAAGTSIEADIAAFEAVGARRKAEEGRKVRNLFRQIAEAVWTASCLEREAEALEGVRRLKAVHA